MAKTKLDPATWKLIVRIMITILQMILNGVDPKDLEMKIKKMEDES